MQKTRYQSKPHHHAYYERVKTYDIINEENPTILKRIATQTGSIKAKDQEKEYSKA